MTASAQLAYRFNGFRVDPVRRLLFGADGQPISLKPKVFDTLLYLVERPGELVAKEALLEAVWPHVVVEENNLNKAISTLRQVFGETRDEHRFIVTEPGRGYRFVASVETVTPNATGASSQLEVVDRSVATVSGQGPPIANVQPIAVRSTGAEPRPRRLVAGAAVLLAACALIVVGVYWFLAAPTPSAGILAPSPDSVAVLPFENLSPDVNRAYFAVAIREEIVTQLTQLGSLRVVRTPTDYVVAGKSFPEIARELNVEMVMDASVLYSDVAVSVHVRLTDGVTGETPWSYSPPPREFSDIITLQSDIALGVARALNAELLPAQRERIERRPTASLDAYNLYQSALARQQRTDRDEQLLAIKEVQQALRLDENFVEAWVVKSELCGVVQFLDLPHAAEHRAEGERAARRALALDPQSGPAHAGLAFALSTVKNWKGGEAEYREARRLNVPLVDMPAYALLKQAAAHFSDARAILQDTWSTSPGNSVALQFLMHTKASLGDWTAAAGDYETGARLFQPWELGHSIMLHWRVGRGDLAEARAIPSERPVDLAMIARLAEGEVARTELRRLYQSAGPGAPGDLRDIGLWAGYFGETDLALDAMRAAVNEQGGQAYWLWLPQLRTMRQLPEFKTWLREIGLVAYWEEYGWPAICRQLDGDDFECD